MKRQQKVSLISFLSILFLGSFLFLSFAFAQGDTFGLQQVGDNTSLGGDDIRLTIALIIRAILGLLGVIAVSIMLYGGFVYMTAGGNEEKIGTAKKILINGTIGLVIILSSFSIAQFIIMQLGKATGAITDDTPNKCLVDEYANFHKCECYNFDCGGNDSCKTGLEQKDYFVVKSITPVTDNTGMNNVVIRVIFNKDVADKFSPDDIFEIKYKTQYVTEDFNFEFFNLTNRQMLQATSTVDFCVDGDTGDNISCLDFGNYRVEVRPDLESAEGYTLQEETDCGTFPIKAEFEVGTKGDGDILTYLDFDGLDDRVYIGEDGNVANFTDDFSVSTWLYIDEQPFNEDVGKEWSIRYIIDNFTGGTPGAGYAMYYHKTDHTLRFSVRRDKSSLNDPENIGDQVSLAYPVEEGKWYHVTTLYTGEYMSLYLDGEMVKKIDLSGDFPIYPYPGKLTFGGTQSTGSNEYCFKGKLDEVRLYDKILSPEEILELSQSRESSNYDNLYAGYHFEEGEGEFVGDFFDGEYHGVTYGGVSWVDTGANTQTIDKEAPTFLGGLNLLGVEQDEALEPGKVYWLSSNITDNSGLGGYHIEALKQTVGGEEEQVINYLDGPRIARGSNATEDDPFEISYPLFTSFSVEELTHYTLILDAVDIDNNFNQIIKEYILLPGICFDDDPDNDEDFCGIDPGDPCTADWQCVNGNKCVNNICTPWPKIVEVDPMHGAADNWVTIYGYHFGEEEGEVYFDLGDGQLSCGDDSELVGESKSYFGFDGEEEYVSTHGTGSVEGVKNNSFEFNGNDSIVFGDVTNEIIGDNASEISISLWFNTLSTETGGNRTYLASLKRNSAEEGDSTLFSLDFGHGSEGSVGFVTFVGEGNGDNNSAHSWLEHDKDGVGYNDGEWHHAVAVLKDNNRKLYLDNVLVAEDDVGMVAVAGNTSDFTVGAFSEKADGEVQFSFDGQIDEVFVFDRGLSPEDVEDLYNVSVCEQSDDSIPAKIVDQSGCGDTWRDNYIIVEVPKDVDLPLGSKSSIRVVTAASSTMWDSTTNDYGADLGLFEKDDINLPGLCSILTTAPAAVVDANSAPPYTPIRIVGNSLGSGNISRVLYFDNFDISSYDSWTEKLIMGEVPDINLFGETAVSVVVAGKKSNSIRFEILDPNDPDIRPVITEINPTSTTPGSYVTIFGSGFDGAGQIFIANSSTKAESCAASSTLAGIDNDCIPLDLLGFPIQCSNTWNNNQVIAKVSMETATGTYFLALRNGKGYYTSGVVVDGVVEEQPFEITDGEPNPGICKIVPKSGIAPRVSSTPIMIYGDNFTSPDEPTDVYFWKRNASSTDMDSWLSTKGNIFTILPFPSIVSVAQQEISTYIPYINNATIDAGTSMISGPIKVGVGDDRFSNAVKYTVADCREASQATVGEMSGYQCCEAEGPDQGKWKKENIACIGESRDAGYVWRFSTGEIDAKPRVLEQCDEANWNNSNFDEIYPSPTPSTLWESTGESACINSVIAVRFNVAIASSTISSDTVKVYDCGKGDLPICLADNELGSDTLNFKMDGNTLEIRRNPPASDLSTSTWYHVEFSKEIESANKLNTLGELANKQYNLETTADCNAGGIDHCIGFDNATTSYYFDFKTADYDCQMTAASINPKSYTTHYLGKLFSPDGLPPNPFYYKVWGISDKECIVISADQYAWEWQTNDSILKINITPPDDLPTSTSRVNPDALNEYEGLPVIASTGIVKEGEGYEKYNIDVLEEIEKPAGLIVTSTDTALFLEDFAMADFVSFENYKINLKYTLDEIATSSMVFVPPLFMPSYQADRYLFDDGVNYILIRENYFTINKKRTRELVSNLWSSNSGFVHTYDENDLLKWKRGAYRIINDKDGFQVFDQFAENIYEPIYSTSQKEISQEYAPGIFLGIFRIDTPVKTVLHGSIDELIIEKENSAEVVETIITATNTTTISVYPPRVIDYGPNCGEACVNASVWVKFSRAMAPITYKDENGASQLELYECETEKCIATTTVTIGVSETSDKFILRANLLDGKLMATSTWYMAVVKGGQEGVKAEGSIADGVLGKAMENDFVWKFRTKSDPSPCKVDEVKVSPDPFAIYLIGDQTKYSAIPLAEPDQCSSVGQELNPWSYGWSWETGDSSVATTTNFSFGTKMSPYCNLGCVLSGSDVSGAINEDYLCGNGSLDPGEDCDIGIAGEVVGVGCTLECLRPGNSNSGDGVLQCGNGNVDDKDAGEECDPGGDKTTWKYCTQNCLNTGSSPDYSGDLDAPWCKSGTITDGEDCDLAFSVADQKKMGGSPNWASVGCSANCLHVGTPLSQEWCDDNSDNPTYKNKCKEAISWCGDGVITSGEECEITNTGFDFLTSMDPILFDSVVTSTPSYYCNSKCLLKNICELEDIDIKDENNQDGLRCLSGTEGCNLDCTITGSSISYNQPSLCGDGVVGVGEYDFCESKEPNANTGVIVGNAVQRVTSIGLGEVTTNTFKNETILAQYTTIEATVESYFGIEGGESVAKSLDPNARVTGSGDYFIACGFEEYSAPNESSYICSASETACFTDSDCEYYEIPGFDQPTQVTSGVGFCWNPGLSMLYFNDQDNPQVCSDDEACSVFGVSATCKKDFSEYKEKCEYTTGEDVENFVYNLCPYNDTQEVIPGVFEDSKTYGVADNSCCYERPYPVSSYPSDGTGFDADEEPVCPNTLIEFDFDSEIDKNSIKNNFTIAVGHTEDDYNCLLDGLTDVTDKINKTALVKAEESAGFFQKIWNFIKGFFVRIFASETFATKQDIDDIHVWCAGNLSATSQVVNKKDASGQVVTSTVQLYLDSMLPINSYIAIHLTGGNKGITDVRGVGIKNNPDNSMSLLEDSIVFYTGAEICKINSVEVDPAKHLFDKPNSSYEFEATAKTKTDQSIVSIAGQYDWELSWQPQGNEIVNIPAQGFSATTTPTTFSVNNLEGSLLGVANIKITEDKDTENGSDKGKIFTGTTYLEVNFCENPWPERDGEFGWEPFIDNVYNFSFSYCADSGLSGTTADDLPYLEDALEFTANAGEVIGTCLVGENPCLEDTMCDSGLVVVPGLDEPIGLVSDDFGVCWDTTFDLAYIQAGVDGVENPIICSANQDCIDITNEDAICKKDLQKFNNTCQLPEGDKNLSVLSEDTLLRYVFFNKNKNDDVFGVQVFKNSAETDKFESKSISQWYAERFDNVSAMQPIQLAGYNGLTDGRSYYVNALNETPTGEIYSNVYLFSVNKDAQQNTLQMFEKILNSIEFNINITDHGKCMEFGALGNTDAITDKDCSTDFDCRDSFGFVASGTDGVCSADKTKLFRDLERLPKIAQLQNSIIDQEYPEFASGSFIPGYTVSRWPTSWSQFGTQDEINNWLGCSLDENGGINSDIDMYTCWNAASSTYHCPVFSSVFEYEFVSSTGYYMLHGPLEYFDLNSPMVEYFIDEDYYSTEPWCTASTTYSPFGEKCGDGIVNPGEQCDPPGNLKSSSLGYKPSITEVGHCVGGINNFKKDDNCLSSLDCGLEWNNYLGHKINTEVADGVCVLGDDVVVNNSSYNESRPNLLVGYGCEDRGVNPCSNKNFYRGAPELRVGDSVYVYDDKSQHYYGENGKDDLFDFTGWRCVSNGDFSVDGKDIYFIDQGGFGTLGNYASFCKKEDIIETKLGSCNELGGNYQAYKMCNNSCQWDYSSCESTTECGNGIVEQGEACDDGVLNGTYGHCAGENSVAEACKGLHEQSCGNGEKDFDAAGNPLEFCEVFDDEGMHSAAINYSGYAVNSICDGGFFAINQLNAFLQEQFNSLSGSYSIFNNNQIMTATVLEGGNPPGWITKVPTLDLLNNCAKIGIDCDFDGVNNAEDNCPNNYNSQIVGYCSTQQDISCNLSWQPFKVAEICPARAGDTPICLPETVNGPDTDNDSYGDACDECPNDSLNDFDKDGLCADIDNCPNVYNPEQKDVVTPGGAGDACDPGTDDWYKSQFTAIYDDLKNNFKDIRNNICEDYVGICENFPDYYCRDASDCNNINTNAPYIEDLPNTLQQFEDQVTGDGDNGGSCIPFVSSYASDKENSCSWDCQGYGAYCGDGKVKVGQEECDDGNKTNQDGCNNDCLKENMACLESGPQYFVPRTGGEVDESVIFITKIDKTLLSKVKNKIVAGSNLFAKGQEQIGECFDSTGSEICRAAGLACNQVQKVINCNKPNPSLCDFGFDADIIEIDCEDDLQEFVDDDPTYGGLRVVCDGEFKPLVEPEKAILEQKKVCGNNIVETYTDENTGKEVKEVCDLADKNGIECIPKYNDSCTYCSSDCTKILTVDSLAYCGNSEIDLISQDDGYESCEDINGQIVSYNATKPNKKEDMNCLDKGEFLCQNQCTNLVNNCVDCGFMSGDDGGVSARVNILNVLTGGGDTIGWPQFSFTTNLGLHYIDENNSIISSALTLMVGDGTNSLLNLSGFGKKINTNLTCNESTSEPEHYAIRFSKTNVEDEDVFFDFPVQNEQDEVVNEYAISPPVPPNTFRAVVKWTDENEGVNFLGSVFNEGNGLLDGDGVLLYGDVAVPDEDGENNLCAQSDYENCYDYGGIYVHPKGNLEKTFVQATTIDTSGQGLVGYTYGFTVSQVDVAYSGKHPIAPYKNSNITVEVYENRGENQDPLSIYKPDHVFEIKDSAGTSSNDSAEYWHVFNLVYNPELGEYEVKAVEKIKTGQEEVWESIPSAPTDISQAPSGSLAESDDFYYDSHLDNMPVDLSPDDFIVVGELYDEYSYMQGGSDSLIINGFPNGFNQDRHKFFVVAQKEGGEEYELPLSGCPNIFGNPVMCYTLLDQFFVSGLMHGYEERRGIPGGVFNGQGVTINCTAENKPCYIQDDKMIRLEEGLVYKYIYKSEIPFHYHFLGKVVYNLEFVGPDGETKLLSETDHSNSPFGVDYGDYGDKDTQWYAFNITKKNGDIYINIVDQFLPPEISIGQYENYE